MAKTAGGEGGGTTPYAVGTSLPRAPEERDWALTTVPKM